MAGRPRRRPPIRAGDERRPPVATRCSDGLTQRSIQRPLGYPHQSERLSQALARAGLDALIASSPANVAYVTGLLTSGDDRSRRYAVYSPQGTALVVPASE